jgi:hypothetical protein
MVAPAASGIFKSEPRRAASTPSAKNRMGGEIIFCQTNSRDNKTLTALLTDHHQAIIKIGICFF